MKILRRNYKFSELFILRKSLFKILLSPKKLFNLFLVRISYFFKMRRCLGLPLNIYIEPIANCNYQCVKCERFSDIYRDGGVVFEGKNMPLEYYHRIIDDIGDTLLTLRLWHYGEPLLNKDIFRMVKYAKRKKIIVAISSNLSLLTKESAEELIRSGLDYLVISFDGASRETYRLYHGRDYFNKVVNNIRTLIETKKRFKSSTPFVELQFIVMKENEKEMFKVRDLGRKLGVNKITHLKLDTTNIDFGRFKTLNVKEDILPANKIFCLNIDEINRITFCSIPWEETEIRYSGLILPCCQDLGQRQEMGRLFQNGRYISFRRIWNNSNYHNFRRKVASNINSVNICFNCAQRNINIKDQILFDKMA